MTHSALTNQVRISQQSSSRQGATVDTVLWHHQAGFNDDATIAAMVDETKEVSANYTISNEGRLTNVVPEELRAFTSGSSTDGGKGAAWDRRSITIEIENESGDPDWKISDKALATAAALFNDLRDRYPIVNNLGHRDLYTAALGWASYPTFCPGIHTVGNIAQLANAARVAALSTTPIDEMEDEEMEHGIYAKGHKAPNIYWIRQTTGKRRAVTAGEWAAVNKLNEANGLPTGDRLLATIDQGIFDAIDKY